MESGGAPSWFEQFAERHSASLAEQEVGIGAHYALIADDGSILGPSNPYFATDGIADLACRVAQHVADRGAATATVRGFAAWR